MYNNLSTTLLKKELELIDYCNKMNFSNTVIQLIKTVIYKERIKSKTNADIVSNKLSFIIKTTFDEQIIISKIDNLI